MSWSDDPRYAEEKKALLITGVVAVVAIAGVGGLLYVKDKERLEKPAAATVVQSTATLEKEVTPPTPVEAARAALLAGDAAGARQQFEEILATAIEPGDIAEARQYLGVAMIAQGQAQQALEFFEKAISENPEEARYYFGRALALRALKEYDRAIADLRKASTLDSTNFLYPNMLYLVYVDAGRGEEARQEVAVLRNRELGAVSPRWVVVAAVFEADSGRYEFASTLLNQGRSQLPTQDFQMLLQDPVVAKHREHPALAEFYSRLGSGG